MIVIFVNTIIYFSVIDASFAFLHDPVILWSTSLPIGIGHGFISIAISTYEVDYPSILHPCRPMLYSGCFDRQKTFMLYKKTKKIRALCWQRKRRTTAPAMSGELRRSALHSPDGSPPHSPTSFSLSCSVFPALSLLHIMSQGLADDIKIGRSSVRRMDARWQSIMLMELDIDGVVMLKGRCILRDHFAQ